MTKKTMEKGNLRIVAEIFTIFKFLNFTALWKNHLKQILNPRKSAEKFKKRENFQLKVIFSDAI